VLAVREWVARDGVIPRGSIGILVVAVAVGMALAVTDSATPRTASGVAFVIPLMLGVGLWRAGGRREDQ